MGTPFSWLQQLTFQENGRWGEQRVRAGLCLTASAAPGRLSTGHGEHKLRPRGLGAHKHGYILISSEAAEK